MDHTGYQQKHQPSHWQRHVSFCLIFIQVSRGELAGPLSNSVQIKYLISSDDVHVLGFISHWVKFYHIQIEVIIKQQYFTQQPSGILCPIVVTTYLFWHSERLGVTAPCYITPKYSRPQLTTSSWDVGRDVQEIWTSDHVQVQWQCCVKAAAQKGFELVNPNFTHNLHSCILRIFGLPSVVIMTVLIAD